MSSPIKATDPRSGGYRKDWRHVESFVAIEGSFENEEMGKFKCVKCGWVHAGISETGAIAAVTDSTSILRRWALKHILNSAVSQPRSRCANSASSAVPLLPALFHRIVPPAEGVDMKSLAVV